MTNASFTQDGAWWTTLIDNAGLCSLTTQGGDGMLALASTSWSEGELRRKLAFVCLYVVIDACRYIDMQACMRALVSVTLSIG